MRVLFTGFTSRTVGSDRNVYDYMSNVNVLRRALELAGHTVDARPVSLLEDVSPEDDYDCALVGIAAVQGLSSRYKLGALWTLHRFGSRAGIFPSDGKNVYTFPSSVLTCLSGDHRDNGTPIDPLDYMMGALQRERNNVVDAELGGLLQPEHPLRQVWRDVLERLPHSDRNPTCAWPVLIPTFSWGNPVVYERHFGARVTLWDPTNVALPMQFDILKELADDARLPLASGAQPREKAWVLTSLQDNTGWLKKQGCKWPVVVVGNKRQARDGRAVDYLPERQMIDEYYGKYVGHLAFGYPLAEGGWWRMRYVHAALAGIVTCCDPADARRMPEPYRHSRVMLERWGDTNEAKLGEVAREQHLALMQAAATADAAVTAVDAFVKGLAS